MASPKILIVDDDKNVTELIKVTLETEGFATAVAYDGKKALEKIGAEKPDLVILDIMMPKVDGWEVLMQLRDDPKTQDIPVILVTAKTEEISRVLGLKKGADDYVTKPFNPVELTARVSAVLRRVSKKQKEEAPTRLVAKEPGLAKIPVREGKRTFLIDVDEIVYVEKKEKETFVYTLAKTLATKLNLNQLEERLNDYSFFRIHRSYLVNLNKAKELAKGKGEGYFLVVDDAKRSKVPVGRRRVTELKKSLSF